ncbi:MAG: tripartite tricarboxylate transporter substrate binding protein [Burkholderiales bacterium]|nr:tripartite tricarboxylate transporter substrate binding protein [Burkholderiales bacterium]
MKALGRALAALGLALACAAHAQDNFPSKPISLIVPWPAGGSTDIVLRGMAQVAEKHLGQPIVIDNKGGAGGTLGPAAMAANAKPDGYTIAQIPITVFRYPYMKERSVTWDPLKDFTYIIHLTGYTFGITTGATSPFKTWQDVVAYAKANPGKVTYGTPGAGTSLHIGMEMIADASGIKLTQVPMKGAAETNAAVLGGHTMLQADSSAWRPLVDAGKLRLLALWTAERSRFWPQVPTLKDLGYPFVFDSPFGIAGPKGMDPKVTAKLHDAFKKALEDKGVLELMDKFVMVPRYAGTQAYTAMVKELCDQERAGLMKLGLAK